MKKRNGLLILWVFSFAILGGCAHARYPLPMTATQLTTYNKGWALGAYLRQPDASAEVCDQQASIPHIKVVDDATRKALDHGFRKGRIPPREWNLCMSSLLHDANPVLSQALMDDVAKEALDTLQDKLLETDAPLQARLESIWQLFSEGDANPSPSPAALKDLVSGLQRDVAKNKLGPFGLRHAKDLLDIFDLAQGRRQGKPVDSATLDDLLAKGDEKTLSLCMRRLPDAALRTTAERYVIRLRIKSSPFPEVRGAPATVEKTMMSGGTNPVSLRAHPLVHGRLDAAPALPRNVVVEQDVVHQTARLISYAIKGSTTPTVLPSIPLRGVLQVDLTGISKPVTVCSSGKDLDVSPCLIPGDLELRSAFGTLNSSGVLHFTDTMDESAAAALARSGENLVLPISVGGRPAAKLEWPVSFETPPDLIFGGRRAGEPGPDLDVQLDVTHPTRLIYSVSARGIAPHWAIVQRSSAETFHIVSQGAIGYAGSNGSDGVPGASGIDGADASCPSSSGTSGSNGSNGGSGSDGGSGGLGGDGGDISVTAIGDRSAAAQGYPVLQNAFLSLGGEGGPGGIGGTGGAGGVGGRGGSGTLCWTTDENGNMSATSTLNGGSNGADGMNGNDGADGQPGPPGRPGRVSFVGI